ncbi:MAG: peptide chain release factor N(5)-glutamine methyltransferase [Pseudomonadota bacterium]
MSGVSWDAFLRRAKSDLAKANIDNAAEEARWLVKLVAHQSSADLIARGGEVIPQQTLERLEDALIRRSAHEPLQHIVGETEFFGITLKTDGRALIPRADSECVVELGMACLPSGLTGTIADLGAGTGALLIAIMQRRVGLRGIAVERSEPAAGLTTENLERTGLAGRAVCFSGSWTEWTGWGDCDLIISNPPYIRSDVIPTLAPEVREHDPIEALDGGTDGLAAYREIIGLGAEHMKPGAWLVFEIGYDQKNAVTELLAQRGFTDLQHAQDLGGHDRAIAAKHA